jgi:hypothetical protein
MAVEDVLEVVAARHALEHTPQAWLDAARGAITPEDAARRVEDEEDPALVERSKQLFAPGDPAVDEQRLQQLLAVGFDAPRQPWRGALAAVLAMAAVLVLVLVVPWSGGDRSSSPLPRYALELDAGARIDRGAEPSTPTGDARVYADRSLRVTLRPWDAVDGAVEAAAYACEAEGPRRLPIVPSVTPSGLVEVDGRVAALGLGVGSWELRFVVGRAGSLPELRTCEAEARDVEPAQLLRTRIEILAPPR